MIIHLNNGQSLFLVGMRGPHTEKFYCMPTYQHDAMSAREDMIKRMSGFTVESVVRVVRWK